MNIFISGISGTAMGPLAMMAKEAGLEVFGSDKHEGAVTEELRKRKIEISIGEQDGEFLAEKNKKVGIDWFVYTSALPKNHPELVLAKKLRIKVSKRDELIAFLVKKSAFFVFWCTFCVIIPRKSSTFATDYEKFTYNHTLFANSQLIDFSAGLRLERPWHRSECHRRLALCHSRLLPFLATDHLHVPARELQPYLL